MFGRKGINDKIVFNRERLLTLFAYVVDNPRRLLLKRHYPDLFRRNLHLKINGDVVDCVGNLFLLRKPMLQVHVRRVWDEATVRQYCCGCVDLVGQGVLLISPFIHPAEREIRRLALERGGSIVQIVDRSFGERFKPSGQLMDICAAGRLLLVSESVGLPFGLLRARLLRRSTRGAAAGIAGQGRYKEKHARRKL